MRIRSYFYASHFTHYSNLNKEYNVNKGYSILNIVQTLTLVKGQPAGDHPGLELEEASPTIRHPFGCSVHLSQSVSLLLLLFYPSIFSTWKINKITLYTPYRIELIFANVYTNCFHFPTFSNTYLS
jgi:hypothetical protein